MMNNLKALRGTWVFRCFDQITNILYTILLGRCPENHDWDGACDECSEAGLGLAF